jgi:hypothetical protein
MTTGSSNSAITHAVQTSSLADILERVLDKGIVIAGDIKISLADIELLNIKIRLLVASVDKAQRNGHRLVAVGPGVVLRRAQGPR